MDTLLARQGETSPRPRLHATERACSLLNRPQRLFPSIHITGTNGKSSTSRISESLLRAAGLRTGLFTSPHIEHLSERIVIDGNLIDEHLLADTWRRIEPTLDAVDNELLGTGEHTTSFFEALTVLAFVCFADAGIDAGVIEVGVGGEWDATNVIEASVSVFTPISLDHTDRLGRTVTEIARTKSKIIKSAAPVITAAQPPYARLVIESAAQQWDSALLAENRQFDYITEAASIGQLVSIRVRDTLYPRVHLPLLGQHQAQNAAVAVAAVTEFLGRGSPLLQSVVTQGLADAQAPGRFQLVGDTPPVYLDAAHNPGGAAVLTDAMATRSAPADVALVIGMLADKDVAGTVQGLLPCATMVFCTETTSPRTLDHGRLAKIATDLAPEGVHVFDHESLDSAMAAAMVWARQRAPQRSVLVTGSVTMIADAVKTLRQSASMETRTSMWPDPSTWITTKSDPMHIQDERRMTLP